MVHTPFLFLRLLVVVHREVFCIVCCFVDILQFCILYQLLDIGELGNVVIFLVHVYSLYMRHASHRGLVLSVGLMFQKVFDRSMLSLEISRTLLDT